MTVQKKTVRRRNDLAQLIGRRVRRRRRDLDWTQAQLSALSGVSPSVIHKVECGSVLTSLESLYRIADSLKIPLSDLFAEDESKAAS